MFKRLSLYLLCTAMIAASFIVSVPKPVSAAANTYYVDGANGSDSTGNGSSASPWKSISKAASVATAGDTVKIRTGVYRETVKPANSGSSGAPITFEPDTGADVTVSGTDLVTGPWTSATGLSASNVYETSATLNMGDYLNQVYVDGIANNWARSPNTDVGNYYDPSMYEYDNTQSTGNKLVDNVNLNQSAGTWDGAAIFYEDSGAWNFSTAFVSTSTPGTLNIVTSPTYLSVVLSSIDNVLRLVNQNGTVLGSSNISVQLNTVYNVKVVANDSTINVYLNNGATPVITANDPNPIEGSFELGVQSGSSSVAASAQFTNVNAAITSQSINQTLGKAAANFTSNLEGWANGDGNGYWKPDGTTLTGYTQPQISQAGTSYSSATKAKNFTYSADVKLNTAGQASLTFRKQDLPYIIGMADWGLWNSEYYIMGKLAALDYPGEWFYDKAAHKLYLKTTSSDNPSLHTVEVKARNLAFDLTHKSNIVIKGLKLFAATIDIANGENNVIDGINAKYVTDYYVQFGTAAGICLCGNNNTLKNSEIAYSSGSLVSIKGEGNRVFNNIIHDGTYGGIVFQSAIEVYGVGHLISNNTVYHAGRSLIGGQFYGSSIQYNDFYSSNGFATDTGLLYTAHSDLGYSEIHHNYWHDYMVRSKSKGSDSSWSAGVYLDNGTYNALVYNNVTWGFEWRSIMINYASNFVQVYNNTGYDTSTIEISRPGYTVDDYMDKVYNNITVDELDTSGLSIGADYKANLTSGDPLFVDPANHDFRLQTGSPARNAGIPIAGITDPANSAPDIGAIQSGAPSWTVGANLANPPAEPTLQLTHTDYRNLLVNGPFELDRMGQPGLDGLYGWTRTYSQTAQPVIDVSSNMTASRIGTFNGASFGTGEDGIEQTITGLQPNTTYEVKGYLRAGTSGQTVRLGVKNYAGTGSDTNRENTSTAWTPEMFTFTTGTASTSATVYIYKPTTGGYAFADDISVTASTETPTSGPNLALNKTAAASSVYGTGFEADKAVDGDEGTRWAAAAGAADPQSLSVDLGSTVSINQVRINWNGPYATSYQIQVSTDGTTWTDLYSTTTGSGGIENITFAAADARYVRLYATARSDPWYGITVKEFEVYGTPPSSGNNLAMNKTTTASSVYGTGFEADKAVDGDDQTRWAAEAGAADPQWLSVDLGSTVSIDHVKVNWNGPYATSYQIQISTDGTTWTDVYSTTSGAGGIEDITFTATNARYVRVLATARSDSWYGVSINEYEVYGTPPSSGNNLAMNKTATASSVYGTGFEGDKAVDGDDQTRWAAAAGAADPQWLSVDLGSTVSIDHVKVDWNGPYATSYQIQVSTDGTIWTDVYSTTSGAGGIENITFAATNARYVRVLATARSDPWYGVTIKEFEVYGQ